MYDPNVFVVMFLVLNEINPSQKNSVQKSQSKKKTKQKRKHNCFRLFLFFLFHWDHCLIFCHFSRSLPGYISLLKGTSVVTIVVSLSDGIQHLETLKTIHHSKTKKQNKKPSDVNPDQSEHSTSLHICLYYGFVFITMTIMSLRQ